MRFNLDDYDDSEVRSTFYKQYVPQTTPKKPQSNSTKNTRNAQNQYLQSGNKFIKGPIDLEWLSKAMELGFPATRLALLLLFKRGIQGNDTVTYFKSEKEMFHLDNASISRSLSQLETAGLVTVSQKQNGKKNEITLHYSAT